MIASFSVARRRFPDRYDARATHLPRQPHLNEFANLFPRVSERGQSLEWPPQGSVIRYPDEVITLIRDQKYRMIFGIVIRKDAAGRYLNLPLFSRIRPRRQNCRVRF